MDFRKCIGCTKCLMNCPVEAIRVKNGKAVIYNEKCIDCGECIKVCPYGAHISIKIH
ncbi:4Fe-4S binding protein [Caloramator sp. mosi_1]|nr:4Fe-4S binding protein [Caloramator sp. mosi_1]WDC85603.1 4Fe-4S binding protein [Caloramator sp. mosi_1]